jgi:hypothetical protein
MDSAVSAAEQALQDSGRIIDGLDPHMLVFEASSPLKAAAIPEKSLSIPGNR